MKMKFTFLIFFLFSVSALWAQEVRQKYIGIETGFTSIESEMSNMDFVRGDIPSYPSEYSTNSTSNLTSLSAKNFIGVKFEIFYLNDRFGLFGGLRYSRMYSSIGKNSYWGSNTNFFYWLYREEGVNTEYLKVKEIDQKSDYIGIPVELRFFPGRRPHLFRMFFKLGAEINYCIQTQHDIVFYDEAMNPYKKDLIAQLAQPKNFYSALYGGAGIRIGRDLKPSVSIEVCTPYLFLTSKSAGMVNPIFGGGLQLNIQIPIKSKVK